MSLRCVIVEDEKPAREKLCLLLGEHPDVDIAAQAGTVADAVDAVALHRPNLLFLDVQIPGGTGFDVLRSLPPELVPFTIFTTAFDQYAVQAFSVRALDYLLKPFGKERLVEALDRARAEVGRRADPSQPGLQELLSAVPPPPKGLERLLVKLNERYVVVRTEEIEWIEAAANYVVLHTRSGNHVLRKALTALDAELPQHLFFRASRSATINLSMVSEIEYVAAGEHTVVLRSGARVPLTRGMRELQEKLQFLR